MISGQVHIKICPYPLEPFIKFKLSESRKAGGRFLIMWHVPDVTVSVWLSIFFVHASWVKIRFPLRTLISADLPTTGFLILFSTFINGLIPFRTSLFHWSPSVWLFQISRLISITTFNFNTRGKKHPSGEVVYYTWHLQSFNSNLEKIYLIEEQHSQHSTKCTPLFEIIYDILSI